jgi:hypothetical protein
LIRYVPISGPATVPWLTTVVTTTPATAGNRAYPSTTFHAVPTCLTRAFLQPEKRKDGGSTPPLTTSSEMISQPSHLRRQREERDSMALAAPAKSKINTEATQLTSNQIAQRGQSGGKAARNTRGAVRMAGDARDPVRVVVEVGCGIVVYPPEEAAMPWRAVFAENGRRRYRQAMTEAELAAKVERVKERLAAGAANLERRDPQGHGNWTWHSLRMAGHANYRITLDMYVGTTAGILDRARQATQ